MLLSHVRRPRGANTVLASDRAAHTQGELVNLVRHAQRALDLVGIVAIDQQAWMEAATADVAICRDENAMASADVLDRPERLWDDRHWHGDVFTAICAGRARPQRANRGAHHRARLPQRGDALRLVRPLGLPC